MYLLRSSLAAALLGARRVLVRRGWVGEKAGLLSILRLFCLRPILSDPNDVLCAIRGFPQPAARVWKSFALQVRKLRL